MLYEWGGFFIYSQWRIYAPPQVKKCRTYQSNICICPTDYPVYFHHGKRFSLLSDPTTRHLSVLRFHSESRNVIVFHLSLNIFTDLDLV